MVATYNWTAESISPTKSGSGGVKHSGFCSKIDMRRESKAIKMLKVTRHQS